MRIERAARADAILHPQRLRIVRALAQRPCTAKELLAAVPDISQATMYRHIALLHETGVIEVVEERPLRGAVERTYGLGQDAIISAAEVAEASRDDQFRYFAMFSAGLMGEYGAYLDREEIDLERDGVGYRQHVLNLSRDELVEMVAELRAVLAARLGNAPSADRIPRLVATVTMPISSQKEDHDDDHER